MKRWAVGFDFEKIMKTTRNENKKYNKNSIMKSVWTDSLIQIKGKTREIDGKMIYWIWLSKRKITRNENKNTTKTKLYNVKTNSLIQIKSKIWGIKWTNKLWDFYKEKKNEEWNNYNKNGIIIKLVDQLINSSKEEIFGI